MKRTDRKQWYAARTLADLGELTAQWLEGDLASQPGYMPNCGPDPETAELIPTLAALNRAGYLTDCSQPGEEFEAGCDGAIWGQRAAVEGWAEPEMRNRLMDAAVSAGLIVVVNSVARRCWRWRPGVPVTTRAGRSHTWFGVQLDRRHVRFQYNVLSSVAVAAILHAERVTIVDPEWGRNEVLWPLLDKAAGAAVPGL